MSCLGRFDKVSEVGVGNISYVSCSEGGKANGAEPEGPSGSDTEVRLDFGLSLSELRPKSFANQDRLKSSRRDSIAKDDNLDPAKRQEYDKLVNVQREVKSKNNEVDPAKNKTYLDLYRYQKEIEEEMTVKLALEERIGKCLKEFDKLYAEIKCHVHMCFFKYKQDDLVLEPQVDLDKLSQFKADLANAYQKCKSLVVPTGAMNRKAD